MRKHRRFPTEILVKQQVFRRRRNPLLAAHHVGDAHQVIVDDIGEMISRQAVRFHQHLHVNDGIFELDLAAQSVVYDALALGRNFHADNMGNALGIKLLPVGIGQHQTGAVIFRRLLRGNLMPSHVSQFFRRAIAFERMAIGQQPVAMLGINRAALGLTIRAVRASDIGALVPAEA